MELLGPSLEEILKKQGGKLNLKSVVTLGEQMINCIEFLHSRQLIHRDLKPENFLLGFEEFSHKIHLVDLGLTKRYIVNG